MQERGGLGADDFPKLVAEFIGTFGLIFMGGGAIIANELTKGGLGVTGIAFAHGLAIATGVSATGAISGGHLNPAVTCAFMATRRLAPLLGIAYIIAQCLGALVAGILLALLSPAGLANPALLATPALAPGVSAGAGIVIEAITTFFLLFAVFGTAVDDRAPRSIAGFGIGMVITMDILAAGPLTGAAMNPARWLGTALPAGSLGQLPIYWIGPILGAVVSALLYEAVLLRSATRR